MSQNRSLLVLRGLALLVFLMGLAFPVTAQQSCWTVAGASTVLDIADLDSSNLSGPTLTVSGAAPVPVGLDGRQSVTGILQDNGAVPRGKRLLVRYRDNGPEANVTVELRQVNLFNGSAVTLATFSSDAPGLPQQSTYQTQGLVSACVAGGGFDFNNNAYFVIVRLDKTGPNGNPGLWLIQVCSLC